MEPVEIDRKITKKGRGIFYTPDEVTEVLCHWAMRTGEECVLEPSFGGCGFLRVLRKRLLALGCNNPESRLFGCDIDPAAFDYLAQQLQREDGDGHFILGDFMQILPSDFATQEFDVVVGNPPYVSHHNMSIEQREAAWNMARSSGIELSRMASLWAYFVVHALRFVKPGGRIAWILPGSFLYAEYASGVRRLIEQSFRRSLAIRIEQRLFLDEGTEENTVVLLAEEFQNNNTQEMELAHAVDLSSLRETITLWQDGAFQGAPNSGRAELSLMEQGARDLFMQLQSEPTAHSLGEFLEVRIGIVTGASRFFIIDEATAQAYNLPNEVLTPILSKFRYAPGMVLTALDIERAREGGYRCLLVDTRAITHIPPALKHYLSTFPEENRKENITFKKRNIWHVCDDGNTPDAFFPYMHAAGPALVLNRASLTSTNSIHRVYFNRGVSKTQRELIALATLSTFGQLSAEIEGRNFGAGGLKHEPSEVLRIKVLLPHKVGDSVVASTFKRVDKLLRRGLRNEAQAAADEVVLGGYNHGRREEIIRSLTAALQKARSGRRPLRLPRLENTDYNVT